MSLKYALLGLLAECPQYGYEIKQRFESKLGNVWSISYGQLYPTLRRLSETGCVTKQTAPGKKAAEKNVYSLTKKGRQQLNDWLLKPLRNSYSVKDEFTMKFLFFRKLKTGEVLEYLKAQHRRIETQCKQFEDTLCVMGDAQDFFVRAIIRKGIVHLQAEQSWLQDVIAEISTSE